MVIRVENEISNLVSNPGQDCVSLHDNTPKKGNPFVFPPAIDK